MTELNGAEESTRWLEWLYGDRPDGLIWIGGHGDGFKGRTFTEIGEAVAYGQQLNASSRGLGGVYHRLTTMRHVEDGRGAAADSAYLPGFAMDLDIKGPGHKALNYPETEQDLVTLLRKAGLPEPSAWVHSGGGRYPFWKLEQPADLTLPGALEDAASASLALHRLVIEWAAESGWKVDNTSDLARIYRLPGTINRKADQEIMARVLWDQSDTTSTFPLWELRGGIIKAMKPSEVEGVKAFTGRLTGVEPAERSADAWMESQLFGGPGAAGAFGDERRFNTAEAMQYVQPALDALRNAADGEINNRLNDAAVMMAHFGEEFWSREAAETQLYGALEHTAYDGGTWQASTTITSAYNAMALKDGPEFWRAVKAADPVASVVPEAAELAGMSRLDWLESQLVTASELAARPAPTPLVYGMLDMNSQSWLIGEPGSFKSFVALDLAACVGAGRPWQGKRTRQTEVLYLAAEGADGMTLRTRAWQGEYGEMAGVTFLPLPIQVGRMEDWQALVQLAKKRGYGLIVIDTQARVTVGLDENTAKDAGVYVAASGALRDATGACVLTVHHTGRDGKNARGSSAIDGAQDSEFKLTRSQPRSSLEVLIKDDKQKDMAEDESGTRLKLKVIDLGWDPTTERALSSLVLLPQDAWRGAEQDVEAAEVGQETAVPNPEAWTMALEGHNRRENVRRILQALHSTAGEVGLTEAKVQRVVLSRWYGDRPLKDGREGHLSPASWSSAWTRARELVSASGEQVVVSAGGQSWAINAVAVREASKADESE